MNLVSAPHQWVLDGLTGLGWVNAPAALIIMTIAVRVGLFPLARRSARSLVVQGELLRRSTVIVDEHPDDKDTQLALMRDMYEEHGTAPFAFLWPMLIQAVVFIGLYHALSSALADDEAYTSISGPVTGWWWLAIVTSAALFAAVMYVTGRHRGNVGSGAANIITISAVLVTIASGLVIPAGMALYLLVSSALGVPQYLLLRGVWRSGVPGPAAG